MAWLRLNGDLFIRTALQLLVFNFVTAQGTQFGPNVLAANAMLISAYCFNRSPWTVIHVQQKL